MKVVVLTTSYPRRTTRSLGTSSPRRSPRSAAGVSVDVVSPGSFPHFGVALGAGIAQNLRAAPWKLALVPAFLAAFAVAARRATRDADLVHAHWIRRPSRRAPREAVRAAGVGDGRRARAARAKARATPGARRPSRRRGLVVPRRRGPGPRGARGGGRPPAGDSIPDHVGSPMSRRTSSSPDGSARRKASSSSSRRRRAAARDRRRRPAPCPCSRCARLRRRRRRSAPTTSVPQSSVSRRGARATG